MAAPFYVRLAVLRDIPRITEISLAGRPDDPAFDYLWRYRCQYPDDNYFFSMQKFKATLYDPKRTVLVAVERPPKSADNEAHEEALETIVGYAVWERNGSRSGALPWFLSVWQAGPWDLLHRRLSIEISTSLLKLSGQEI